MGSAQGPVTSEMEQARTASGFGAHTPLSEKLLAVAIRAQNFTGSTGVAIALAEGQEMICRANWGTSAPEVGSALSIEHSFTGLCVRTGEPARCDDAQSDPRVDSEACQALGISAIATAPVRRGLKVIGLIAAFSDTPNAFTDKHLLILTTLAEVIVEILDDPHPVQPLPQIVEAAPDLARAAAVAQAPLGLLVDKVSATTVVQEAAPPAAHADPAVTVAPATPVEPEPPVAATPPWSDPAAPPPQQTKTGFAGDPGAPVMPSFSAPAATPASSQAPERATPHDSVSDRFAAPRKKDEILPAAMDPGPPPQPTRTGSPSQSSKTGLGGGLGLPPQQTKTGLAGDHGAARLTLVKQPTSAPAPDFAAAAFTFAGFEADSSPRRRWLLPAAVLAIFTVIAVAGWRLHVARNASVAKPAPAAPVPELESTSAPQPEQAQEVKPFEPAPPEPKHSPFRPPPMADVASPPMKAKAASEPPADVTIRRGREPVVEFIGPIRRRPSGSSDAAPAPEAQAPQLALPAPDLPAALARPTPAAVVAPVSRMVPAQLVQRVEPLYPETARRLQISSRVVVKATITKAGTVGNVQWVSGSDLFRDTTIAAVKRWRYKPATLNGQPVESDLQLVLQFNRPTNQ